MKKRFFALAIATLALSACGLKSPETTTTAAKADNAETTAAKADVGSAEVTLVYAEVNPLDTIVGQTGTVQVFQQQSVKQLKKRDKVIFHSLFYY